MLRDNCREQASLTMSVGEFHQLTGQNFLGARKFLYMSKLTKAALWATCVTPVVLSLTMVRWAVVSDPSSFFVVWHIPFYGAVRVPDWMWVIPASGTDVTPAVS